MGRSNNIKRIQMDVVDPEAFEQPGFFNDGAVKPKESIDQAGRDYIDSPPGPRERARERFNRSNRSEEELAIK